MNIVGWPKAGFWFNTQLGHPVLLISSGGRQGNNTLGWRKMWAVKSDGGSDCVSTSDLGCKLVQVFTRH